MMKIVVQLVVVSMLLFTKCGEQKLLLEPNDALTFEKAEYKRWVAGISGGGAGYAIVLSLKEKNETIILEKIVFKNWIANLHSDDAINYYASINDGSNNQAENTLGGDIGQSKTSEKIEILPFALEEDESVIYYTTGGEEKLFKLKLEKSTAIEAPRY